mmetsp:Transcript_19970/g.59776  ORF Transcript_19970/g.59776 Transcript_19970/m.59776 type:complete len:210 (+) Transcript_19970:343-972(+)
MEVDARGVPLHLEARVHKEIDVDLAVGSDLHEHVEEGRCVLDVEAHHGKAVLQLVVVLQPVGPLLRCDGAGLIQVDLVEQLPQRRRVDQVALALLEREGGELGLANLHGIVNEDACDNVQQRDLGEHDEEDEDEGIHDAGGPQEVVIRAPIVAPGDHPEAREHGRADRAEPLQQLLLCDIGEAAIFARLYQVAPHTLHKCKAEQEKHDH